jgi:hypothetical protein
MTKEFDTTWRELTLPGNQNYSIGICAYTNKVRHMIIGNDVLRESMIRKVVLSDDEKTCLVGNHCLAMDCPLNNTEQEHVIHMLDMNEDSPVDEDTARIWGADTVSGCYVALAKRLSEEIAFEKNQEQS